MDFYGILKCKDGGAMSRNLSFVEVVGGLAIGILGIWFMAAHDSGGANEVPLPTSASAPSKAIIGPNDPLSAPEITKRIKTLDDILSADPPSAEDNQYFVVHIKADGIFDAGVTAQKILNSVHNHIGTTPYAGVKVRVAVGIVDQYGRQSTPDFLVLTYSSDDISKVVFPTITTFDILNLAQLQELHPGAYQILGDKCSTGAEYAKYTTTFCSNLASLP